MDEEAVVQFSWNTCLTRTCLDARCCRAWSGGEEWTDSCPVIGVAKALGDAEHSLGKKTALQLQMFWLLLLLLGLFRGIAWLKISQISILIEPVTAIGTTKYIYLWCFWVPSSILWFACALIPNDVCIMNYTRREMSVFILSITRPFFSPSAGHFRLTVRWIGKEHSVVW